MNHNKIEHLESLIKAIKDMNKNDLSKKVGHKIEMIEKKIKTIQNCKIKPL